ncbi:hypothetical protein FB451DRAFT_1437274 [Mycena latifolia]|nr:hypothetical protein FB451DRAFT_1437274 [Mycena latifolia]
MAEVLGTVASAIQLVDTALKAREYVKDFYNAPVEQRKLFTELDDVKPLLIELQKRVVTAQTNALQHMVAPLDRFKTMMDKFTAKFELPDGPLSKLSKQLSWTLWNKKEAKEVGQQERDKAAEKKEILAEEKEILDWITSLFFQRQADVFRAWQPGTGEWLLSDATFKNWKLGPRGVLWCQGIFLNFGESSWGWKDCPCVGGGKSPPSQFQKSDTAVACITEPQGKGDTDNLMPVLEKLVVDRPLPLSCT